ncbi:MAG TPA: twin-arginine translocation signal domain-containing protein [Ktedonobacteraceae bacterium]|nr:twin-arginine translocation signal domain-containing protein [Ktedonobacteraceae bacterium]
MTIKRRQFLKTTATMTSTMLLSPLLVGKVQAHWQPMHHRNTSQLTPFVDRLPIPQVIRPVNKSKRQPLYRVTMTQFQQRLHRNLPPTTVWGYNGTYPGPLFEARTYEPMFIQWVNELPTTHFLPIDHTIAGAETNVPDVRAVTHLHGGHVASQYDGNPPAWFTPGQSRTYYYPITVGPTSFLSTAD